MCSKEPNVLLPTQIDSHPSDILCYYVCECRTSRGRHLSNLLPQKIVTQREIDFKKYCKVKSGSYVEASTDSIVTNDMMSRTHGCIALGPLGNWKDSTKCFDLYTGKVVTRRTMKEVPMPDQIKNWRRNGELNPAENPTRLGWNS